MPRQRTAHAAASTATVAAPRSTPKRATVVRTYPNNLLFQYLMNRWRLEAKSEGSKMQYTYASAQRSLKVYPLELENGDEAKALLKGVGHTIAKRLNSELNSAVQANGGQPLDLEFVKNYIEVLKSGKNPANMSRPLRATQVERTSATDEGTSGGASCSSVTATAQSSRKDSDHGVLSKHDNFFGSLLQDDDRETSGSNGIPDEPTSSSSGTVLPQKIAVKRPAAVAFNSPLPASPAVRVPLTKRASSSSVTRQTSGTQLGEIRLSPGNFDIVLIVDNQENSRYKDVVHGLNKEGCSFVPRQLSVGDYIWVARDKSNDNRELVLDWVVERKRLDDLAHSIKEKKNRYREQKARLLECGIENRVFLVENYNSKHIGLPRETCHQATVNTQVHDNFIIWRTSCGRDTARYLALLTRKLRSKYSNCTLISCSKEDLKDARQTCGLIEIPLMTYASVKEESIKTQPMTARQILARQLMVCPQITGAKAVSITNKYGTWRALITAYRDCNTEAERQNLLAKIPIAEDNDGDVKGTKCVGAAASKKLAAFFEGLSAFSEIF